MPREYAIYLRKSRADIEAELRGDGETLARHQRALLELADKLGLHVMRIYHEVVSGETIDARPEMQQLLSDVEKGVWSGVLVMEIERLARGETIDQGTVQRAFMYSATKIITPMKIYDPNDEFDQEYFEFGLFMSRREYKTINRRMQRGRAASAAEGKFVGNKPPYGYRRIKLEHEKGWTLEIAPEEATVVRMLFNWYVNGVWEDRGHRRIGISRICRKLNEMGIPAATGGPWVPGTVQNMLRNPVYAGFVRWNARTTVKKIVDGQVIKTRPRSKNALIYPGRHEAIISKDLFDRTQALLANNPPHPVPAQSIVKNPLSGLVVCGRCGHKMVRRPHPNGYSDTLMCPLSGCPTVSAPLELVEERIYLGLAQWIDDYRMQWENAEIQEADSQQNYLQYALAKAHDQKAVLEKQRGTLHDLLEQGIYSHDTFLSRSKELNLRVSAAEANEKKLSKMLSAAARNLAGEKNTIPNTKKLLDTYSMMKSAKAKNMILKELLSKVTYKKEKGGRWHGSPDNFEITLYPKLPNDVTITDSISGPTNSGILK